MKIILFFTLFACIIWGFKAVDPPEGVCFRFKDRAITLAAGMQRGSGMYFPRGQYDNAKLDTMSNWFSPASNYVEIIRQDNSRDPGMGIALGFEFDETNGEYPYTPARSVVQIKDFGWGGVEFSRRDTMNYTGVSNDVSEDIQVEVEGFRNDTIWGRFSGVLVSGAGPMTSVDSGFFRVFVYRVE